MITCSRCTAVNPPESSICSHCGANLLPGESTRSRIIYIALGVFVAVAMGVTAVLILTSGTSNSFTRWVVPAIITLGVVFMGVAIYVALYQTPVWQRYAERAKRHFSLDQQQALSDYGEAIKLAPPSEQTALREARLALAESLNANDILLEDLAFLQKDYATRAVKANPQKRADLAMRQINVFEKLEKVYTTAGDKDKALTTHLAYLNWIEEHAEELVSSLGRGRDTASFVTGAPRSEQQYVSGFQPRYLLVRQARDDRARLVQSGAVIAIGYCAECGQVYRPKTLSMSCPYNIKHGRLTHIEYVLPQEIEQAEAELLQKVSEQRKAVQAA